MFYKLLNRCTLQVKRTGLFWTNKRPWERISVRFSISPADPGMIARYVDGLNNVTVTLPLMQDGVKEVAGKRLGYMEAMARLLQQTQTGSLEDER